jgi:hypothetical protein
MLNIRRENYICHEGKKMSSWNDEWVQLPSGECSFLLQWQPCLNKMLRMYYFPWDQSDKCFLSVIMWWIMVGTEQHWRHLVGSDFLMTGKHWSDKQNFEIWYTKLIAGPVCQTEAPLLFVSWTEMLSISPSRSPNQLDPLYATLSIGFLDGFPAAVLLL